jgi:hypothetical protein
MSFYVNATVRTYAIGLRFKSSDSKALTCLSQKRLHLSNHIFGSCALIYIHSAPAPPGDASLTVHIPLQHAQ